MRQAQFVVIAQNTLTCGVQEFGIKLSIFQAVDFGGPPKIHPSIFFFLKYLADIQILCYAHTFESKWNRKLKINWTVILNQE